MDEDDSLYFTTAEFPYTEGLLYCLKQPMTT